MEKSIEELEKELRIAKMRKSYGELCDKLCKAREMYEGKSLGNRSVSLNSLSHYKLDFDLTLYHIDCVYISTGYYSGDFRRDSINTFEEFCNNSERAVIKAKGRIMSV